MGFWDRVVQAAEFTKKPSYLSATLSKAAAPPAPIQSQGPDLNFLRSLRGSPATPVATSPALESASTSDPLVFRPLGAQFPRFQGLFSKPLSPFAASIDDLLTRQAEKVDRFSSSLVEDMLSPGLRGTYATDPAMAVGMQLKQQAVDTTRKLQLPFPTLGGMKTVAGAAGMGEENFAYQRALAASDPKVLGERFLAQMRENSQQVMGAITRGRDFASLRTAFARDDYERRLTELVGADWDRYITIESDGSLKADPRLAIVRGVRAEDLQAVVDETRKASLNYRTLPTFARYAGLMDKAEEFAITSGLAASLEAGKNNSLFGFGEKVDRMVRGSYDWEKALRENPFEVLIREGAAGTQGWDGVAMDQELRDELNRMAYGYNPDDTAARNREREERYRNQVEAAHRVRGFGEGYALGELLTAKGFLSTVDFALSMPSGKALGDMFATALVNREALDYTPAMRAVRMASDAYDGVVVLGASALIETGVDEEVALPVAQLLPLLAATAVTGGAGTVAVTGLRVASAAGAIDRAQSYGLDTAEGWMALSDGVMNQVLMSGKANAVEEARLIRPFMRMFGANESALARFGASVVARTGVNVMEDTSFAALLMAADPNRDLFSAEGVGEIKRIAQVSAILGGSSAAFAHPDAIRSGLRSLKTDVLAGVTAYAAAKGVLGLDEEQARLVGLGMAGTVAVGSRTGQIRAALDNMQFRPPLYTDRATFHAQAESIFRDGARVPDPATWRQQNNVVAPEPGWVADMRIAAADGVRPEQHILNTRYQIDNEMRPKLTQAAEALDRAVANRLGMPYDEYLARAQDPATRDAVNLVTSGVRASDPEVRDLQRAFQRVAFDRRKALVQATLHNVNALRVLSAEKTINLPDAESAFKAALHFEDYDATVADVVRKTSGAMLLTGPAAFALGEPMPPQLFHVTTAKGAVLANGVQSMLQRRTTSSTGLGGMGVEDTVSTTVNEVKADDIYRSIVEFRAVLVGDALPSEMITAAREGRMASSPYDGQLEWNLEALVRAYPEVQEHFGIWASTNRDGAGEDIAWRFLDDTFNDLPGEFRMDVVNAFQRAREDAGGPGAPAFYGVDVNALAAVPRDEVAVLGIQPAKRGVNVLRSDGRPGSGDDFNEEMRLASGSHADVTGVVNDRPIETFAGTMRITGGGSPQGVSITPVLRKAFEAVAPHVGMTAKQLVTFTSAANTAYRRRTRTGVGAVADAALRTLATSGAASWGYLTADEDERTKMAVLLGGGAALYLGAPLVGRAHRQVADFEVFGPLGQRDIQWYNEHQDLPVSQRALNVAKGITTSLASRREDPLTYRALQDMVRAERIGRDLAQIVRLRAGRVIERGFGKPGSPGPDGVGLDDHGRIMSTSPMARDGKSPIPTSPLGGYTIPVLTRNEAGEIVIAKSWDGREVWGATPADVAARLELYQKHGVEYFGSAQEAALIAIRALQAPVIDFMHQTGTLVDDPNYRRRDLVNADALYITRGRAVKEANEGREQVVRRGSSSSKAGQARGADFDSQAEAIMAGYRYVSLPDALEVFARDGYRDAARGHVANYLLQLKDDSGASLLHSPADDHPLLKQAIEDVNKIVTSRRATLRRERARLGEAVRIERGRQGAIERGQKRAAALRETLTDRTRTAEERRSAANRLVDDGLKRAKLYARTLESSSEGVGAADVAYRRLRQDLAAVDAQLRGARRRLSNVKDKAVAVVDPAEAATLYDRLGSIQERIDALMEQRLASNDARIRGQFAKDDAQFAQGVDRGQLDSALSDVRQGSRGLANTAPDELAARTEGRIAELQRELREFENQAKRVRSNPNYWQGEITRRQAELEGLEAQLRQMRQVRAAQVNQPGDFNFHTLSRQQVIPGAEGVANTMNKYTAGQESSAWSRVVEPVAAISDILRMLRASTDASIIGVTGVLKLYDQPKLVAQALKYAVSTHLSEGGMLRYVDQFNARSLREGTPGLEEWVSAGLHWAGREGFDAVQLSSASDVGLDRAKRAVETKLPQVWIANRIYSMVGDYLRFESVHTAYAAQAALKGRPLTKGETTAIARDVNRTMGFSDKVFGEALVGRDVARTLQFAGRFFQSQIEVVSKALVDGSYEGAAARQTLMRFVGLGTMATVMINDALGEETDIRPWSSNFMRVRAAGTDISLFGPWDSLARGVLTTLNGVPGTAQVIPDLYGPNEPGFNFERATYMARSKASPAVGLVVGGIEQKVQGETAFGEDMTSPEFWVNQFMPFLYDSVTQSFGARNDDGMNRSDWLSVASLAALSFAGGKYSEMTGFEKLQEAMEQAGIDQHDPVARKSWLLEHEDLAPESSSRKQKAIDARAEEYTTARDDIGRQFQSGEITLGEYKTELHRQMDLYVRDMEQMGGFDESDKPQPAADGNNYEQWLDSYFKLFDQATPEGEPSPDWDLYEELLAGYERKYGPQALDYVNEFLGVGRDDVYRERVRVRDELRHLSGPKGEVINYYTMDRLFPGTLRVLSEDEADEIIAYTSAWRSSNGIPSDVSFATSTFDVVRLLYPDLDPGTQMTMADDAAAANRPSNYSLEYEYIRERYPYYLAWANDNQRWDTLQMAKQRQEEIAQYYPR